MEFSYFLPVHIQFGWDKVDSVADFVKPYGNKALIVTGRTSAKKSGLYDRVTAKLDAAHIEHVLFDQVDANPLTTTALDGAALAKSESCDMVIAIGGGSSWTVQKALHLCPLTKVTLTIISLIVKPVIRRCLLL